MKKKKIVSVIFVSFVLIATTIIASCSSEFEEENYGSYSLQEKQELECLAKEYGLNLEIDETYYGEKLTRSEIENLCQAFSVSLGEYEFIGEENENKVVCYSIDKDLLRSIPEELSGHELVWSGTEPYSDFIFSVNLFRGESSEQYTFFVNIQSSLFNNGVTITSDKTCMHSGLLLAFWCDVDYVLSNGARFLFHLSGTYYENSHTGSFTIRSRFN